MKIVNKLLKEQKFQFPHPMDIIADLAFKAGYQAAIDELKEIVRDDKFYTHIATANDFSKYLEREVEY